MLNLTILLGQSDISKFRLKQITSHDLLTNNLYLITSKSPIVGDEINKLEQLLSGKIINGLHLDKTRNIAIGPRIGTVSPWSSKATEIIHRCGLSNIIRVEQLKYFQSKHDLTEILDKLYDQMTESVFNNLTDLNKIFTEHHCKSYIEIDILTHGKNILNQVNLDMGLALSSDEIDYLYDNYLSVKRNPTDVELMMFAQANSEHCRHKIFNAKFIINGEEQPKTLFEMIKDTYKASPNNVLVAYNDNSSVINGILTNRFYPKYHTKDYQFHNEMTHILMKVETHNHPTAIAPFAGAATGSGGEIRDEGATGRGSKPKAGLTGFSVSSLNLDVSHNHQASNYGKPEHIQSALNIMLEGPIGGASFNNEFGRPNLCGYFRSFQQQISGITYGYHKPIMIAGGYGNIEDKQVKKSEVTDNALIIQLGGPGFLIGLGGGSASSMTGGENRRELDFNSVQRSNPEMERRCQEVIDICWQLGDKNPILSIHDVGAGGLSNAVPELVHGSDKGGTFELRDIPTYDSTMSPLETWCNESQERYVIAIEPSQLELFTSICKRENCPIKIIGRATQSKQLTLNDKNYDNKPIDIDIDILLGKPPRTVKDVTLNQIDSNNSLNGIELNLKDSLYKVISHPTVANKSFLITIGDRTVGGLTVRDQMVGKWQIPVADCAITTFGFSDIAGEVMAMGERTPIATLNAEASGRMAVAESLTNIASCLIDDLNDIKLSANWMASCGSINQDALLYKTVNATSELCQKLNIAIPVGKDSLSMKTSWVDNNQTKEVISPVSLIISAFSLTNNVTQHQTPELKSNSNSSLILLSLNHQMRMGASILQETQNAFRGTTPDIDDPNSLINLFNLLKELHKENLILAYHDKSDGGLVATLCEMLFASRIGIELNLMTNNLIEFLFNEEIGVVIQVDNHKISQINHLISKFNVTNLNIAKVNLNHEKLIINNNQRQVLNEDRFKLQELWSNVSYNMQKLRDNPECADSEFKLISEQNPGLYSKINFDIDSIQAPFINSNRPKIAILREQGVNGQLEMAAAFTQAGFEAFDIHINDLLSDAYNLDQFIGFAACGGFSYGDVLGAGQGWAKSILFNNKLKDQFSNFFNRDNTFAIGICNGCQMMSHLAKIIPGAESFPQFKRNISEQFEARLSMVEIQDSPSIFFKDMQGSQLPIIVSHGEGRAEFQSGNQKENLKISMRYIDNHGRATERYPLNPNGSPNGIASVTSLDGRFTIMMPHPERSFRTLQMTWQSEYKKPMSPWFKLFVNAKQFTL